MPSLNEFHAQYQAKGVKLLALSDEASGTVEKFIGTLGIAYPVGLDEGGKTTKAYGVTGLPTAFVIDTEGEVVWRGHPASHDELMAAVEAALSDSFRGALPASPHQKLAKVVEAFEAGRLGTAHKAAAGLTQDPDAEAAAQAQAVTAALEALVKARREKAAALAGAGAYHDARRQLQRLGERLEGAVLAKVVAADVAALEKDPAAKKDLAAGELLEKAIKAAAAGDAEKADGLLQKLLEKYPDTKVADRARSMTAG